MLRRLLGRARRIETGPVDGDRGAGILSVLDAAQNAFTFPMLDNGYVYLAATRMSLHRSETDWAIAIEIFGFSPRAGEPDVSVWTFASRLANRKGPDEFVSADAHRKYLLAHQHDDAVFFHPVEPGWQDADDPEVIDPAAQAIVVRGSSVPMPTSSDYEQHGIDLGDPARPRTFELCRYLAAVARDDVLATPVERRTNVPADLTEVLVLDEWRHPDLVGGERPSTSEAFRQIATVLVTGDVDAYRPVEAPNTHWSNWPEGGTL